MQAVQPTSSQISEVNNSFVLYPTYNENDRLEKKRTVYNQIYKKFSRRVRNTSLFHLNVGHIRNISNIEYAIRDRAKLLINIDHKFDNHILHILTYILILYRTRRRKTFIE